MSNERMDKLTRDYQKLAREMYKAEQEWADEAMPDDVKADLDRKYDESLELKRQIEDEKLKIRRREMDEYSKSLKEIPESELRKIPTGMSEERKSRAVAGYVTVGDYAVASKAHADFVASGAPPTNWPLVRLEETVEINGSCYVPLTKSMREEIEEKAVPTLGTGVIEPQRLPITPQVTADRALRIRDVMPVGRTTSDAVTYIREESYTRSSAYVPAMSVKPEAALQYTQQTANVQTIAVWLPATVQQLSDWGRLRALIDNRLRYDIRRFEETEVIYGAGGANAFQGLATVSGTQDIATADDRLTTPTIIDQIMVGATEVRRAGYEPNAVVLDPIDYEAVVLTKGDDDHYLRQVFPTAGGEMQVWGLQLVQAQAMSAATGTERNLIVGDFRMAELILREDIGIMLGFKDDDFIRNLRTILGEERAAFAIYAPAAFAVLQTAA